MKRLTTLLSFRPDVRIRVCSSLDDIIISSFEQPAHSWVRNFYNFLYFSSLGIFPSGSSWGDGYLSMRSTNGTYRNPNQYDVGYYINGPVSNSNYGILTGRGATAVALSDYALETPITHGNGANQLGHRAQALASPSYTAETRTWLATLTRLFDNTSGSTITVTECGIVGCTHTSSFYNLLCRDVLASSVDVLNNGVLTISYDISMIFPS